MRKKMIIRTLLSAAVILLFITAGISFYTLFRQKEKVVETNLYSLVPEDSHAILEINNVGGLFNSISKVSYNHKLQDLNLSNLIHQLKSSLEQITDSKAHGLSKQMSRMLISFHQPNTMKDQVLYCSLDTGDDTFIENFIKNNTLSQFPPKKFEYRGEEISIYPLNNNDFLACFHQTGFLALSYQVKLIEKVLDAYLNKQSILSESIFLSATKLKKTHTDATIYLRPHEIPFGQQKDNSRSSILHSSYWGEFDIKLNGDAIYLSGTSFDSNTSQSFNNALKAQQPVRIFSGAYLPKSTYFISQLATSDLDKMMTQFVGKDYPVKSCHTPEEKADSCMFEFIKDHSNHAIHSLLFYDSGTRKETRNITNILLKDRNKAELQLKNLLYTLPRATGVKLPQSKYIYNQGKAYLIFALPKMKFINRFIENNPEENLYFYGCLYNDDLLISSNESSLYAYINQINKGDVKEGDVVYDECVSGLATESNCTVLADMSEIISSPRLHSHLLPELFFNSPEFFRHFILATQFTSVNGYIHPNLILTYKGSEE